MKIFLTVLTLFLTLNSFSQRRNFVFAEASVDAKHIVRDSVDLVLMIGAHDRDWEVALRYENFWKREYREMGAVVRYMFYPYEYKNGWLRGWELDAGAGIGIITRTGSYRGASAVSYAVLGGLGYDFEWAILKTTVELKRRGDLYVLYDDNLWKPSIYVGLKVKLFDRKI